MGAPFLILSLALFGLSVGAFVSCLSTPAERMRAPGKWFWAGFILLVPGVPLVVTLVSKGFWRTVAGKTGSVGDILFGAPRTDKVGAADAIAGTYGVGDTVLWFSGFALVALIVYHLFAARFPALRERTTQARIASILSGLLIVRLLFAVGMSGGFLISVIILAIAFVLAWLFTVRLLTTTREFVAGSAPVWVATLVATLAAGVVVGLAWTGDHAGLENLLFWLGWAGIPLAGLAAFHRFALPAPALRDVRVLRVLSQMVVAFATMAMLSYLADNLLTNMTDTNITTTFEALEQPTGFAIQAASFRPAQPIKEALVLLTRNTFAVVIIALPLTLIVGTMIGIMRLSSNWLLSKLAMLYVELLRNIPVVVVIIFLSQSIILPLPVRAEAYTPFDLGFISNNTIAISSFVAEENARSFNIIVAVAILIGIAAAVWRTRQFVRTGTPHHRVLWFLGTVLSISLVAFFVLGDTYSLSRPGLDGLAVRGGLRALAPYVALTIGLIAYTASHVAEIVRGSILAVAKGQSEAANAVALSGFQRYRYVILPQAMRIAVPALINQGLNLTKNSSLALAVGYAEITFGVFTAIGNANPAPQLLLMLMIVYLTFSLTISFLGNIVNRRLQLVTN